jgi:hypothetical protein
VGKWRDAMGAAVSEGKEETAIAEASTPLPWTPAQTIALDIVELAVIDVNAIDLPAAKRKEQKVIEITQDIVRTSFVTDCIKVTHLSSSSGEGESGESESDKDRTIVKLMRRAIKTHLVDDPDENSWNVTVIVIFLFCYVVWYILYTNG